MKSGLACIVLASVAVIANGTGAGGALEWAARELFDVESTVLLNDVTRRDKEVSYRLRAAVAVQPEWRAPGELLLRVELRTPSLLARGVRPTDDFLPLASSWDARPLSLFYAHMRGGLVLRAHLDRNAPTHLRDFQRSLLSALQVQTAEGESNETDASGACRVSYESIGGEGGAFRKVKSACPGEWGASRRVARYELSDRRLRRAHVEEVHEARLAVGGLKARAWLQLLHVRSEPAPPAAPSLSAALAALPSSLQPADLFEPPPAVDADLTEDDAWLRWERWAEGGEDSAGEGGSVEDARRASLARATLCVASQARLATLLAAAERWRLPPLLRVLGSCGTQPSYAAVAAALDLRVDPLATDYLDALALAPTPHESVVEAVLKLSAEEGPHVASALAAVGASLRRLRPPHRLALRALAQLDAALAACRSELCRLVHLRALANAAHADSLPALLHWAERGTEAEALAALDALEAMAAAKASSGALDSLGAHARARLSRLGAAGRPLAVRAAALDLLLRASADAPFGLVPLLHHLMQQPDDEIAAVLWQRLEALGEPLALLRASLPSAMRARARLAPATSTVLVRALPALARSALASLDSLQVAQKGALRRGLVRLTVLTPTPHDALAVDLSASGLGGLMGDASAADEPVSAALALTVGGVRRPRQQLFSGQGELAAAVWAGTASTPTPVLRALLPLPPATYDLRLLDGAVLRFRAETLAAVALDAHATVSVWSRNAQSGVAVRGGILTQARLAVRTAWGELTASAELTLAPQLRIASDVDFYDGLSLCARVSAPDRQHGLKVRLAAALGSSRRAVRRFRDSSWLAPGRTLSLGGLNDAMCRTLVSSDNLV